MALADDINALPTTVGDGNTGHLNNHQVIHAALKDHESRLGARDIVGTGTPEGRITAAVGTTYTDSGATNGAIRWIKTSGTGATGWRVEYGDTGWRDITSSITDPLSPLEFTEGSKLLIRRTNNIGYLKIVGLVYVRSAHGKLCNNFNGFRAEGFTQVNLAKSADLRVGLYQIRIESGVVDSLLSSASISILGQWDIAQAWPSTLPGTPA